MFYVIKFNAAIAAMGIDPRIIPADLRQMAQTRGKETGCSPQEAAFILMCDLPLDIRMMSDIEIAYYVWVKEGKIRTDNPAIQAASLFLSIDTPRSD